ncbi:MAG: tetraacyldisaccharide 4'-kinase [Bacteroidales bacterium]|nr:tetraacyldisaccharide 4'-kinase [Bacteroidales bacterium]
MYLLITILRNFLFRCNVIKSESYNDVCVVCVGNLRVGGTGKTPMIEYLIRNLKDEFPLAVISLGYKRKTKGLKEVLTDSNAEDTGDEPKQMKLKFPQIPFFVNKDRNFAIDYIRKNLPETKLILLDDAYQYRKTQPNITVLLTEYTRPYFSDRIIPYGRLRESKKESKRADYIIVTKCPENIIENDKNNFIQKLNPAPHQKIFFSKINYKPLSLPQDKKSLLFVAGIDNPEPATEFLKHAGYDVYLKKFADHHPFSFDDIKEIRRLAGNDRIIITTEKDAVRLKKFGLKFESLKIENEIDGNFIQIIKDRINNFVRQ